MRKSLDLTNWEAAHKLVRELEMNDVANVMSLAKASEAFYSDNAARRLSEQQQRKYRNTVGELKDTLGNVTVRSVTVDDLRKIREGWKLSPITQQKRIEMLRSFFRFCMDSGWTDKNPARALKCPIAHFEPTMPFTPEEMKRILWAADSICEIHQKMRKGVDKQVKALILLMRYGGLRITDAVNMSREKVENGNLFLYQQKTKFPVYVPLPDFVLEALKDCEEVMAGRNNYFYWGPGTLKTSVTDWQDKLQDVFTIAGIDNGHAHRFRDSFSVDLLSRGVAIQTVSKLLGHTSIKTTEKHYAPWVKSSQDALEAAVKATW